MRTRSAPLPNPASRRQEVKTRLSAEERRTVECRARAAGLNISDFLRLMALGAEPSREHSRQGILRGDHGSAVRRGE